MGETPQKKMKWLMLCWVEDTPLYESSLAREASAHEP
jgi:hypothetical protein